MFLRKHLNNRRFPVCIRRASNPLRLIDTQICPGSSGSGSRTGTSGFSGGSIGSCIGGGEGSDGIRSEYPVTGIPSICMVFRCRAKPNGSRLLHHELYGVGETFRNRSGSAKGCSRKRRAWRPALLSFCSSNIIWIAAKNCFHPETVANRMEDSDWVAGSVPEACCPARLYSECHSATWNPAAVLCR
jgi:hypothetical protein